MQVANEVTADKGDNSAICTGREWAVEEAALRPMELNARDLEKTKHYF